MSTAKDPQDQGKRSFARAELLDAARRWMFETRGSPRGMEEAARDRFHEDLGLLIEFVGEMIPESPSAVMPVAQSAWASWSKQDLAREIQARMTHFYGRTDGTIAFPSSAEGDILKMVHALLSKSRDEGPARDA